MNLTHGEDRILDQVRLRFVKETGTDPIRIEAEQAGPERFAVIVVGRPADLYKEALLNVGQQLPDDHPFKGRIRLSYETPRDSMQGPEVELLRSLIGRSLSVSPATADAAHRVEFAPFVGGKDLELMQQANHVVVGRRGTGKSSLILATLRRLYERGESGVWIDMQRYHKRDDLQAVAQVIGEILAGLGNQTKDSAIEDSIKSMEHFANRGDLTEAEVRRYLPRVALQIRQILTRANRAFYVFMDDVHLIAPTLQPLLVDMVYSLARGSNVWLKLAYVRNLAVVYDPVRQVGLNIPNDAQLVTLDQTLVDPAGARDHLMSILRLFLNRCGYSTPTELVGGEAVERLVWCSAGVPRDFLALFSDGLRIARESGHKRLGVQDVNVATGEFAAIRMQQLPGEFSGSEAMIRAALDEVQSFCLDESRNNAFLALLEPGHPGYKTLVMLADLRFVHLLHPSITAGRAGVRYEAYLLDYSFYTGMRRRQNITEVKIEGERPKRAELRRLPRLDLERLNAVQ